LNSRRNNFFLLFIVLLALGAAFVVWPQNPSNYLPGTFWPGNEGIDVPLLGHRQGFRLGLDLQGGTHLTLRADTSRLPQGTDAGNAVDGATKVIERRINAYGVAEPVIQRRGADRIIVELPGVRNIEEAKNLIGKTAQMDFRERKGTTGTDADWVVATAVGNDGVEKPLTGQYFKKAEVRFNQRGTPEIGFQFDDEGAKLFGDITKRNLQKPIGIFLDGQVISSPTVQAQITSDGVIQGSFTPEEAKNLAIQLNAGALPVPVSIEEERTVDATLGADSVRKSVIAGEIALLVVAAFMIMYYRMLGVVAWAHYSSIP